MANGKMRSAPMPLVFKSEGEDFRTAFFFLLQTIIPTAFRSQMVSLPRSNYAGGLLGSMSANACFRQQSLEVGGDVCKHLVPILAKWQALRPTTLQPCRG